MVSLAQSWPRHPGKIGVERHMRDRCTYLTNASPTMRGSTLMRSRTCQATRSDAAARIADIVQTFPNCRAPSLESWRSGCNEVAGWHQRNTLPRFVTVLFCMGGVLLLVAIELKHQRIGLAECHRPNGIGLERVVRHDNVRLTRQQQALGWDSSYKDCSAYGAL